MLQRSLPCLKLGVLAIASLAADDLRAAAPSSLAELDFFEKKIRPVLVESCYECHSATSKNIRGGLLLDSREGVLKGGDSGPAIVVGNPKKSLLITGIRHEDKDPDMAMPPKKEKLSDAVIADFEQWVTMGAPDPRTGGPTVRTAFDPAKAAEHWAFKKVSAPPVPNPANQKNLAQNPIDHFVLESLAKNKLQLSQKADKHTLIRRVTYDLTGLPPSPSEVEAFVSDTSPDAYERLVDRLIASPHYGERWARHWLDIARYADTTGDRTVGKLRAPIYSYAWTYRDYVINAFNNDLPYDRFIVEQIAADHLPETKDNPATLAALGFLTLGKRFMGNENDVIDDRIDVVTKGLMGLTGACARCHDHKFDPVPTKDYYSLHGVFASSEEPATLPLISEAASEEQHKQYLDEVAKIQKEISDFENSQAGRLTAGMLERAGDYLMAVQTSGKSQSNFRNLARDKGLKAEVAAVWQDQLKVAEAAQKKKPDPILSPWITLAAIPEAEFSQKAPESIAALSTSNDTNPGIVAALKAKNPTSLAEVASVYTTCFEQLHKSLQLPTFATGKTAKAGAFEITQKPMNDENLEVLRKDVFGAASCMHPEERVVAKTFGVQYSTPLAIIRAKFAALDLSHPGAPIRAMALVDKAKPKDSPVLIRGEATNRGPVVPRRFLTMFAGEDSKPFQKGSGRLELAQSIASKDNPLTARVIANRVWQWHFGQGIVRSVSDFGTRSEAPSHPELLNWMAAWLMDHNWSLKQLNKLIVMSATYQQDSKPTKKGMETDPTNQWLWRYNVQRLDFEEVRDTLLTLSGHLDQSSAGGRPFKLSGATATDAATKKRYGANTDALKTSETKRSVYAMVDRAGLPEMFNTFDFANPDISTGERVLTTVPQQALFMMNSPFIADQVRGILQREDMPKAASLDDKVRFLFRLTMQRPPTTDELEAARKFINSDPSAALETNALVSPIAGSPETDAAKAVRKTSQANKSLDVWERYTQVLLLTNELMFVE
jgi:hypothetical protein